jgi:hypothetical protein
MVIFIGGSSVLGRFRPGSGGYFIFVIISALRAARFSPPPMDRNTVGGSRPAYPGLGYTRVAGFPVTRLWGPGVLSKFTGHLG